MFFLPLRKFQIVKITPPKIATTRWNLQLWPPAKFSIAIIGSFCHPSTLFGKPWNMKLSKVYLYQHNNYAQLSHAQPQNPLSVTVDASLEVMVVIQ